LTNQFPGLARGPIDHNASSVINSISNGAISMGSAVLLKDIDTIVPIPSEILPRVEESTSPAVTDDIYGVVVGGDTDGIYGDGTGASDDSTRASSAAGQGVVVVTQGRCLARVDTLNGAINVGDQLSAAPTGGGLLKLTVTNNQFIIARALQSVGNATGLHVIAVDIQREGLND